MNWIADPANRIFLSALIALFAAAIASATALWIATKVYRAQKKIDAHNLMAVEKRESYRDFFKAANALLTALHSSLYRDLDEEESFARSEECLHRLYVAQEALALSADKEAIKRCRDYFFTLLGFRAIVKHKTFGISISELYKEIKGPDDAYSKVLDAREKAIIVVRAELLQQDRTETQDDLQGLFERKYIPEEMDVKAERSQELRVKRKQVPK